MHYLRGLGGRVTKRPAAIPQCPRASWGHLKRIRFEPDLEAEGDGLAGETSRLADFVVGLRMEHLPSKVVSMVKMCLIDHIGVASLGSTLPWGAISRRLILHCSEPTEATLIGWPARISACKAALINGIQAHGFEWDDTHAMGMIHPGAVIFPPTLAIAEKNRLSGETVIEAIVAGYEVVSRVGMCLGVDLMAKGYHPMGTFGQVGAAVAVGKLLRLSVSQMENAISLAAMQSGGLVIGIHSSMAKRFYAGKSAMAGILAARLGMEGFEGPGRVMEARGGFIDVHSSQPRMDLLTQGLGDRWETLNVSFKPYPTGRGANSVIDGVLRIREKTGLSAEDIDEVIIGTSHHILRVTVIDGRLEDPMSAQMSLPYCAAVALVRGRVTHEEFRVENFADPEVRRIMGRTKMVPEDVMDQNTPRTYPASVTIRTRDGQSYREEVLNLKGDPENPMSREEIERKYAMLAELVFSPGTIITIKKAVANLEGLSDISELMGELSCTRRSHS